MWSYAFRTAAESMAVTPLRLTKAVGMPWRWACWLRSTRAQACGTAAKAERRRQAAEGASAWTIRVKGEEKPVRLKKFSLRL